MKITITVQNEHEARDAIAALSNIHCITKESLGYTLYSNNYSQLHNDKLNTINSLGNSEGK